MTNALISLICMGNIVCSAPMRGAMIQTGVGGRVDDAANYAKSYLIDSKEKKMLFGFGVMTQKAITTKTLSVNLKNLDLNLSKDLCKAVVKVSF